MAAFLASNRAGTGICPGTDLCLGAYEAWHVQMVTSNNLTARCPPVV
jgi:hypothetical protein